MAASFGNAQKVLDSWALLHAKYAKTWACLKKATIKHYSNMQYSSSYIDVMLNIRPRTSNTDNLDAFTSEVMQAFNIVREYLPQPDQQTVVDKGGAYTDAQVNTMLKAAHKNVIDQICMAFLIYFLPPQPEIQGLWEEASYNERLHRSCR